MVVLLEVVVGYEVAVELEVQHEVLAPDVPGHGEVLHVAALLPLVPGAGQLPLVAPVIKPGTDDTGPGLKWENWDYNKLLLGIRVKLN